MLNASPPRADARDAPTRRRGRPRGLGRLRRTARRPRSPRRSETERVLRGLTRSGRVRRIRVQTAALNSPTRMCELCRPASPVHEREVDVLGLPVPDTELVHSLPEPLPLLRGRGQFVERVFVAALLPELV